MRKHLNGFAIILVVSILAISLFGCGGSNSKGASSISEVKDRHVQELMSIPGVVGVGIGGTAGEERLVVYLENGSPELRARIPAELEDYEVVVEVTGAIKPL